MIVSFRNMGIDTEQNTEHQRALYKIISHHLIDWKYGNQQLGAIYDLNHVIHNKSNKSNNEGLT
ncbi:hypothetical protein [Priestia megaterium]|uniref:hypothetical protein n=1 Tax=Priestia megaterium TaxID=1404 RepID=UPI001C24AC66|nr:hypothetical protein [Priestia megaterium]MBU8852763.1 hypothetical protein [Bacillus sp. FJAT-26377]MCU7738878.1 hypothetical protein [Priestia megaterium]